MLGQIVFDDWHIVSKFGDDDSPSASQVSPKIISRTSIDQSVCIAIDPDMRGITKILSVNTIKRIKLISFIWSQYHEELFGAWKSRISELIIDGGVFSSKAACFQSVQVLRVFNAAIEATFPFLQELVTDAPLSSEFFENHMVSLKKIELPLSLVHHITEAKLKPPVTLLLIITDQDMTTYTQEKFLPLATLLKAHETIVFKLLHPTDHMYNIINRLADRMDLYLTIGSSFKQIPKCKTRTKCIAIVAVTAFASAVIGLCFFFS